MSEPIGNTKQLAEPVAVRYDFDGYGYIYMDAGSGSDWASRVKNCEFLYTHPMRELMDEEIYAEMIKCIDSTEDGHTFKYKNFARAILRKAQEPLGEKFEKVLNDNLWEMLEENGEAQEK